MEEKRTPPEEDAAARRRALDLRRIGHYSMVGFVFPLSILIGFFAGRVIGTWLGAPTAGIAVGVVIGSIAAFYNLFTTLGRLEREPPAAPGEGPREGE